MELPHSDNSVLSSIIDACNYSCNSSKAFELHEHISYLHFANWLTRSTDK